LFPTIGFRTINELSSLEDLPDLKLTSYPTNGFTIAGIQEIANHFSIFSMFVPSCLDVVNEPGKAVPLNLGAFGSPSARFQPVPATFSVGSSFLPQTLASRWR